MEITIISAYTWYNKGDAGILLGTVELLNKILDNPKINILSFTPEIDNVKYKQVNSSINQVKSNLFNPYPVKKTPFCKGIKIIKMMFEALGIKVGLCHKRIKDYKQILLGSDLIIVCGGGFLGGNKYNSLIHVVQYLLLNKYMARSILLGASIEPPKTKVIDSVTKRMLDRLDMIFPREDITMKYLLDNGYSKKTIQIPDMAFYMGNITKSSKIDGLMDQLNSSKRIKIGITMREWHFPNSANPSAARKKYKDSLVYLINHSEDTQFIFIPQVIFDGDDDRQFAREVFNEISEKSKFLILEDDLSPYELKYLISKMDQFIGTRMHSNIFAASVGVPPIAIAYEKKTNGIMKKLGLEKYVIDIENIEPNAIENLIIENRKNKTKLREQLSEKIIFLKSDIENRVDDYLKEACIK